MMRMTMNDAPCRSIIVSLLLILLFVDVYFRVAATDTCELDGFEEQSQIINQALLKLRTNSWTQTNSFIPGNPASPLDEKDGGFLFSHSYLPIVQTQQNEGISQQYWLTNSRDGFMTRLAFRLMYGQTANYNGYNGTESYFITKKTITVVAPRQTTPYPCLTQADSCNYDEGQVCELIQPIDLEITLKWPISAKFKITPISSNSASGLSTSGSNVNANIAVPFSNFQLEGVTADSDECNAEDPSFEGLACIGEQTCNGMIPCTMPPGLDQTAIDDLLEEHCGQYSDPWDEVLTKWNDELNTNCQSACCNPDNVYYQRWGVGPPARIYDISTFTLTSPLLEVTASARQLDGSTKTIRLNTTDIDMGVYSIVVPGENDTDQSVQVRLSVQKTYALPTAAIQEMSGGRIVVWGDWDGAAKVPTMVPTIQQAANEGVPATAGWAYLYPGPQSSAGWSNSNNGYMQSQATITSSSRGFGLPDNCPSGSSPDFYSSFYNVPGWYINPSTNETFAVSPCQMSNNMNYLAYNVTNDPEFKNSINNVSLCNGDSRGLSPYLAPGCSVIAPNCILHEADGVFERRLNVPGCGQTEASAVEIYIDFSTDFAGYIGTSGSVGLVEKSTACAYNFNPVSFFASSTTAVTPSPSSSISPTPSTSKSPSTTKNYRPDHAQGLLIVTLINPTELTGHYNIITSCSSSPINATGPPIQWSVKPTGDGTNTTTPSSAIVNVPADSQIFGPKIQFRLQPLSSNSPASDPNLKITCSISVFDVDTQSLGAPALIQKTITCVNATDYVIPSGANLVDYYNNKQNCTFSQLMQGKCKNAGGQYTVVVILIIIFSVIVIFGVGSLVIYCSTKKQDKPHTST